MLRGTRHLRTERLQSSVVRIDLACSAGPCKPARASTRASRETVWQSRARAARARLEEVRGSRAACHAQRGISVMRCAEGTEAVSRMGSVRGTHLSSFSSTARIPADDVFVWRRSIDRLITKPFDDTQVHEIMTVTHTYHEAEI